MPVRPITRLLLGFVLAFLVLLWGEWMLDSGYVLAPEGWVVAAGVGAPALGRRVKGRP